MFNRNRHPWTLDSVFAIIHIEKMLENKLPQLLDQKNFSIRELDRRTGITYTTIRAVVQGDRRSIQLDVLEKICLVLEIQPGDIYLAGAAIQRPERPVANIPEALTRASGIRQGVSGKSSFQTGADADRRRRETSNDWRTW